MNTDRGAMISLAVIVMGLVLMTPGLLAPLLFLAFSPLGIGLMVWLMWRSSWKPGSGMADRRTQTPGDDWVRG